MSHIQGVDLEIVGRSVGETQVVFKPRLVKINGVETALPEGATLRIKSKLGKTPVTVEIVMLVRSLHIYSPERDA